MPSPAHHRFATVMIAVSALCLATWIGSTADGASRGAVGAGAGAAVSPPASTGVGSSSFIGASPVASVAVSDNTGTFGHSSPRTCVIATVVASLASFITHRPRPAINRPRSEEHTSELQSPDHLVCRLLLEKKKQKQRMLTS